MTWHRDRSQRTGHCEQRAPKHSESSSATYQIRVVEDVRHASSDVMMGVSLNTPEDIGRDISDLVLHETSHSMCAVSPRSSLMSRSERRLQHPAGHWHVVCDVSAITSVPAAPASSSLSSRMSMDMSCQTWPHTSVTEYAVFAETSTATRSRTSTDVKYDMAP